MKVNGTRIRDKALGSSFGAPAKHMKVNSITI